MDYTQVIGAVPAASAAHRIAGVVAAMTPPPAAQGAMVPSGSSNVVAKIKPLVPGAVGAVAGFVAWKKHPVLGALAGHAVADAAYEAYKGDKKKAACNLAVEGAGVLGALYNKKIPFAKKGGAIGGYVAGILAGAVATYFVQGSPVRRALGK